MNTVIRCTCAMFLLFAGLFFGFFALGGDAPANGAQLKTNTLKVHLQDGFSGKDEVTVTVEGREVYRGKPKSDPVLGVATGFSVSNVSTHPIVTFSMPAKAFYWSNQVTLSTGAVLGFTCYGTNEVKVRQATNFFYF